jgi:hypothetical protein
MILQHQSLFSECVQLQLEPQPQLQLMLRKSISDIPLMARAQKCVWMLDKYNFEWFEVGSMLEPRKQVRAFHQSRYTTQVLVLGGVVPCDRLQLAWHE